jgi:hypothetical protein
MKAIWVGRWRLKFDVRRSELRSAFNLSQFRFPSIASALAFILIGPFVGFLSAMLYGYIVDLRTSTPALDLTFMYVPKLIAATYAVGFIPARLTGFLFSETHLLLPARVTESSLLRGALGGLLGFVVTVTLGLPVRMALVASVPAGLACGLLFCKAPGTPNQRLEQP